MHLVWVCFVGDHCGAADLRAGAGGGRDRDHRRDARGLCAPPVVAPVLEIPDRPRLAGHEGDRFGGIEPAAAAERDHAVVVAGTKRLDAGLDIRGGRIWPDIGEQVDGEAGGARDLQHPMSDHVLGERRIGDQERPGDAQRAAGLRQLGHPPRPEPHPGRIAPVGAKRLRIDRVHASVSSAGWLGLLMVRL